MASKINDLSTLTYNYRPQTLAPSVFVSFSTFGTEARILCGILSSFCLFIYCFIACCYFDGRRRQTWRDCFFRLSSYRHSRLCWLLCNFPGLCEPRELSREWDDVRALRDDVDGHVILGGRTSGPQIEQHCAIDCGSVSREHCRAVRVAICLGHLVRCHLSSSSSSSSSSSFRSFRSCSS